MAWSGWSYVDTNMSIGKYRLWYRTDPNYSTNQVGLQYYVEVADTGNKTERWNCYVGVSVDGTLHSEGWSNYKNSNTTTGAGSTVPGHSGYYSGYTCISTRTLAKTVSGSSPSASWTLSLAGGFTAVSRRDCTCSVSASDTETSYYYTAVTKGTVTITDNGNNTFKVSGTKGSSGTNNTAGGPILQYSWDNSYWINTYNNADISFTSTVATRTVYARSITTATYGSNAIATANKSLTYYIVPGNPGAPVISYTKSRLTIKEPWTFSWTAASAGNTSSPIAGYRLRLYKNNILIPIKDSEGNTLSSSWSNDYWYDTDNTKCFYTIDPIIHGYAPGDTVKLTIFAYIKTGNNEKLWSGQGSTPASSIEYLVQNAGVMRPLVNGKHVEGVVLVALQDNSDKGYTWTEADIVKVYTPNKTWAEAE